MASISEIRNPFVPRNAFETGKTPDQIMQARDAWTEAGRIIQEQRGNYRANVVIFVLGRARELGKNR